MAEERPTAGQALLAYLSRQVDELKVRDGQVRSGQDEGVHRARVACRRLRATLSGYRRLVDRDATDPVRDELRWLAGSLSDARDVTVVHERLRHLVDAEPASQAIGPVRSRLDTTCAERRAAAWVAVDEAFASDRYDALLDALDRLVTDPPLRRKASRPATEVLPRPVRKARRRLTRTMAAAGEADDHDAELHEVRKEAKRLRYCAEALAPVLGEDAEALARAAGQLTGHLGERQDTVLTRRLLLELAAAADAAGESPETWDRLVTRNDERTAELDRELPALWDRVSRQRLPQQPHPLMDGRPERVTAPG